MKNFIVSFLTLIICIALGEVGLRLFLKDELEITRDLRNLVYRYDPLLGWFPLEGKQTTFTGARTIQIRHNARGFRDPEHVIKNNNRMVFLGDSFLWGYDIEENERLTNKLAKKLDQWSVFNLGVSGYGTDQEFILLQDQYDFYKPDIVFLVFCSNNDDSDNSSNKRYGGYFKPYYESISGELTLQGQPVPESENYLLKDKKKSEIAWLRLIEHVSFRFRNSRKKLAGPTNLILTEMNKFVSKRGAKFIVGVQGKNETLLTFLASQNIAHVSLDNPYVFPTHGNHWTEKGNSVVAEKIYDYLLTNNYL